MKYRNTISLALAGLISGGISANLEDIGLVLLLPGLLFGAALSVMFIGLALRRRQFGVQLMLALLWILFAAVAYWSAVIATSSIVSGAGASAVANTLFELGGAIVGAAIGGVIVLTAFHFLAAELTKRAFASLELLSVVLIFSYFLPSVSLYFLVWQTGMATALG